MVALAEIEKVDLRQVWPNEADHFTPWLAKNIAKLGDALGVALEVEEREASVGSFSLDLLARDIENNRTVVIENQLETTDHTHLGQILTYAAGHDAGVVVWIAKRFRDEHRAAIDFLNGRTGEDTDFFCVVVELWKIGDSLPAVNFDLVATPNEWQKTNIKSSRNKGSEGNRLFRVGLIERLQNLPDFTKKIRKGSYSTYCILEYPTPGVRYAAIWHDGEPGFEMIIQRKDRDWNLGVLHEFEQDRVIIEDGLRETKEESFQWSEFGKIGTRIAIYRKGNINQDQDSWDELQEWMVRKFLRFRKVFGPRLAKLEE